VGLKPTKLQVDGVVARCSNRTIVGLKLHASTCSADGSLSSNRTIVGLKHESVKDMIIVGQAAIAPLWD